MKLQLRLLLVSVVGIMTITPMAIAQAHFPSSMKTSPESLSLLKRGREVDMSKLEELDLTDDQQEEISTLREEMHAQMTEILTVEQMEIVAAAQADGDDMRSTMRSLGLNRSQMLEVRDIMSEYRDNITDVLTPEQRAQLQEESPRDRN